MHLYSLKLLELVTDEVPVSQAMDLCCLESFESEQALDAAMHYSKKLFLLVDYVKYLFSRCL